MSKINRLPPWFKVSLGSGEQFSAVRKTLISRGLNTVCSSARCPNLGECWSSGTATFMILGEICSRNCGFCAVSAGDPEEVDLKEAQRVCEAVQELGLKYVVVTSVTRDDLVDGGASVFADLIKKLRNQISDIVAEVLIPDFLGNKKSLNTVLQAKPDVLNHNVETVSLLYDKYRPQADYKRSLQLLSRASKELTEDRVKSGLMVGLGETRKQLTELFEDLRSAGVGRLTVGQYLQPTRKHFPVARYLHPDEFEEIASEAKALGFRHVSSGPLVRSSYHAADL